ncbi:MAG TPA: hypothetical protein VF620_08385 [Allosphingosinicella sp.]
MINNNKSMKDGRSGWVRPKLQRLEAGAAEANSAITGRGDGVLQQES